jgi:DNA polymerase-3 subunit epsilon
MNQLPYEPPIRPENVRVLAMVDTETTGLDSQKHDLLEVACALYDVKRGCMIEARSWLLHAEDNPMEKVNGLPAELLSERGRKMTTDEDLRAMEDLARLLLRADAVVAWNAAFDQPWIETYLDRLQLLPPMFFARPRWVCAMNDMEWPRYSSSRALSSVALAHGVPITDAHRALADVLTMVKLFSRAAELGANVAEMVAKAALPRVEYRAMVDYSGKELARGAGFRWDEGRRGWFRKYPAGFEPKEGEVPFQLSQVPS